MGYETKICVVNKSELSYEMENGKTMKYAQKIAEFDLSKVYSVSDKFTKYPATDCFFYADDGNTKIIEDRYGESLKEIPIEDAIEIIESAMRNDDYYRRYFPCLALLRGFNKSDWENLVVLHYGY